MRVRLRSRSFQVPLLTIGGLAQFQYLEKMLRSHRGLESEMRMLLVELAAVTVVDPLHCALDVRDKSRRYRRQLDTHIAHRDGAVQVCDDVVTMGDDRLSQHA